MRLSFDRNMEPKKGNSNRSTQFWRSRIRSWAGGLFINMRRKSPVQQWLDSLPQQESSQQMQRTSTQDDSNDDQNISTLLSPISSLKLEGENNPASPPLCFDSPENNCDIKNETCDTIESEERTKDVENIRSNLHIDNIDISNIKKNRGTLVRERSTNSEGHSPRHRHMLVRDSSLQSDSATSRCSSVESLLESRKINAEAILRGVGFGPSPSRQQIARIPDRFLKPSQVKGISTEQFIKDEQKSMKMHECGVFGYRGLTGHPHAPPSSIVAKIIERISSREELPDHNFIPIHADIDSY